MPFSHPYIRPFAATQNTVTPAEPCPAPVICLLLLLQHAQPCLVFLSIGDNTRPLVSVLSSIADSQAAVLAASRGFVRTETWHQEQRVCIRHAHL